MAFVSSEAASRVANAPSDEIIRIEGLRKSFGQLEVLRDINFSVNRGEVVTIIGASGSGKSTLLRCINLLEEPDAGARMVRGEGPHRLINKRGRAEARHRHGVPKLQPVCEQERARQLHARARDAEAHGPRARRGGCAHAP